MDRKYVQLHDGVEVSGTCTKLGVSESTAQPVHNEPSEIWDEERCPPSPSMEPLHGDVDHQTDADSSTDLDARIHLQCLNSAGTVVFLESNHRDLDSTGSDADTSANFNGWLDLPLDMCRLILDRLGAFDILSFPLVSRPWADVYAEKRRLQPGAPTLLTPASDCGYEIPDDYLRGLFFMTNILPREVFSVEVEGMIYGSWIGGKDEWLVTICRGSCLQLLNPATGRCIPLPDYSLGPDDRVQLCRTPAEADGYFAIAISLCKLSYTMEGCDHWITLESPNKHWINHSDAIVHRGKIIAICRNGDLWSWDLEDGGRNPNLLLRTCTSINTEGWEQFEFILAPSLKDNILIVTPYGEDFPFIYGHRGPSHTNHWSFLVHGAVLYEVDVDAQIIEEVRDIGDRALFLGPNYPFYVPVSVPMGDLKMNYLYIAAMSDHDAIAIDLSLEDVPGNVSLINYSMLSNPYQVQMWFRPSFPSNAD